MSSAIRGSFPALSFNSDRHFVETGLGDQRAVDQFFGSSRSNTVAFLKAD